MAEQTLCPRCQQEYFTPYGSERAPGDPSPPALSRMGQVYICGPCGTREALIQLAGHDLAGPELWPVDPNLWEIPEDAQAGEQHV